MKSNNSSICDCRGGSVGGGWGSLMVGGGSRTIKTITCGVSNEQKFA